MAKSIMNKEKAADQTHDALLNFSEVCEEVANDLTKGITQCRKSTIAMRKE